MPLLDKNELAVMFWAGEDPAETLQMVRQFGVRCGQLGIPGDYDLTDAAPAWQAATSVVGIRIYTVFAAYEGESYADLATVHETVGFVPPATRTARVARTLEVSRFAHEMGVPSIATHIGCVPADRNAGDYRDIVNVVRRVCDCAAGFGQSFALETGQEPAAELLTFIEDVERHNLGINFDPANMILYGTGEPLEALRLLRSRVVSVHCKDGKWPAGPGALGLEMPLGKGDVNWKPFLRQLETAGYRGPLAIEREEADPERRLSEIRMGLALLKELQLSDG